MTAEPITDPDDPEHRLLDVAGAAAAAHVSEATIRSWEHRGKLKAVQVALYREIDVLRAEAATRRAPRAKQLADLALSELAESRP